MSRLSDTSDPATVSIRIEDTGTTQSFPIHLANMSDVWKCCLQSTFKPPTQLSFPGSNQYWNFYRTLCELIDQVSKIKKNQGTGVYSVYCGEAASQLIQLPIDDFMTIYIDLLDYLQNQLARDFLKTMMTQTAKSFNYERRVRLFFITQYELTHKQNLTKIQKLKIEMDIEKQFQSLWNHYNHVSPCLLIMNDYEKKQLGNISDCIQESQVDWIRKPSVYLIFLKQIYLLEKQISLLKKGHLGIPKIPDFLNIYHSWNTFKKTFSSR